ncbi:MAG: hypothetical protein LBH85_02775 [Treponema sp.]|jgi:hypothetical protein|nr:hypothetical protein [Treponema sp.]
MSRINDVIKKLSVAGATVLLVLMAAPAWAQSEAFSVSGDLTTIYTLGNAETAQMASSGKGDGAYTDQGEKNGYYISGNVIISYKPVSFLEGYFKMTATGRSGSFYEPLQLEALGKNDFGVSFDSVYGKVNVFDALSLNNLPVQALLKAGKYKTESSYFGRVSKYETESVLYMLKTANTYNYELELQYLHGREKPLISGAFTSNFKFDEAIPRLYDVDGSVSKHGLPVMGKYAPSLFASLKLHDINITGNPLSAEALYVLNGANIYSGHSLGFAARYTVDAAPSVSVPVGFSVGWFEKNIDVLSGTASIAQANATTNFRNTLAAGFGAGLRLTSGDIEVSANLAGAYYGIEHIYRDPLSIISLSIDAQCTYKNRFLFGAGFVAGTLADALWQTAPGVSSNDDNYSFTFTLAENYGFEVYAGVKFVNNGRFIVGFNTNKGLTMNTTLESRADGQIKYRQLDTSNPSNDIFETSGLFFKFVMTF